MPTNILPQLWSPFPTAAQPYSGYSNGYSNGYNNGYSNNLTGLANAITSGLNNGLITRSLSESIGDLTDQFAEFGISLERKPTKKPPPTYLCHLCFKKGHYIKDCPQLKRDKHFIIVFTAIMEKYAGSECFGTAKTCGNAAQPLGPADLAKQ
ncbi:hypothetical protein C0J52_01008 [Blattella germanica]|nr:hypothetical protein C0J52_01008 [Blattella germanica]